MDGTLPCPLSNLNLRFAFWYLFSRMESSTGLAPVETRLDSYNSHNA
jgi:hypothetical protein